MNLLGSILLTFVVPFMLGWLTFRIAYNTGMRHGKQIGLMTAAVDFIEIMTGSMERQMNGMSDDTFEQLIAEAQNIVNKPGS